MKTSKLLKGILFFVIAALFFFIGSPTKTVSALSLDEIVSNPDNVNQVALALHYSEAGNKDIALDKIKEEHNLPDQLYDPVTLAPYVILIDEKPTLSTNPNPNLETMVDLINVDSFEFSTGAYGYVVAKTINLSGEFVIDQTSLEVGVIICGIYANVNVNVTGADSDIIFNCDYALESEEGSYKVVVGTNYSIIAPELVGYSVSIDGVKTSSKTYKASKRDVTINVEYSELSAPDSRVETILDINSFVTTEFGSFESNADLYKQIVSGKAGVVNLYTKQPINGLNIDSMFTFTTEDPRTKMTITDLSTLDAGDYEVTVRFNGLEGIAFSSEAKFNLEITKARATVEVSSDLVKYQTVLDGQFNKDNVVSIKSNTLKSNEVDHAYFVVGLDVLNGSITAKVDLSQAITNDNAMVQAESDKILRDLLNKFDPENDGLTVIELTDYIEELCALAGVSGVSFNGSRLNALVTELDALADKANVKIEVILDKGVDITPTSQGAYFVGVITTDVSYESTYDFGVVVVSPEVANVTFTNDTLGMALFEYDGTQKELFAQAYDLNGNKLDGNIYYTYVGVETSGNVYSSKVAPKNPGTYFVIANFTNGTVDQIATHSGVGVATMLIAERKDVNVDSALNSVLSNEQILSLISKVEKFDLDLFNLLATFDETSIADLFANITTQINNNSALADAFANVNNTLGFDVLNKAENLILELYPNLTKNSVDLEFDSANVFEYTGKPVAMNALVNGKTGNIKYFYYGYQVNGSPYASLEAPTLPGMYIVNAVYYNMENGIQNLSYGYAAKAFAITTLEVDFTLNGEILTDVSKFYNGSSQTLNIKPIYSDGNLATGGSFKVVYVDSEGNTSFEAPVIPGKYEVLAVYLERNDFATQFFGYKYITLTINKALPEVDTEYEFVCYDGNQHFKDAILTDGYNSVVVAIDSKSNVNVYVSNDWFDQTLEGYEVSYILDELFNALTSVKAQLKDEDFNKLYLEIKTLLDSFEINTLTINGKELIEIEEYNIHVFGFKKHFENVNVEFAFDIVDHNLVPITTVNPTCSTNGYTVYECIYCGHDEILDYVEPHGHNFVNPVFNWDNETTCSSATFTCTYDSLHKVTRDVTMTVEIVPSECTEEGIETYTATVVENGITYTDVKQSVIPTLGHDYITCPAQAPTCENIGWDEYLKCQRCGHSTYVELPALGHTYDEQITLPTCTEEGYTTFTCACGDTYIDNYVQALGHDYQEVVTSPTCTSDGYTTFTCQRCGHTYVGDIVQASGHDFTDNYLVVLPTCTQRGYTRYSCNNCEYTYIDVNSYVDAKGHDYQVTIIRPATETTNGLAKYVCSRCDDSYESEFAMLGEHEYILFETVLPTCEEDGYEIHKCINPEHDHSYKKVLPATGHNLEVFDEKVATCLENGYIIYHCTNTGCNYISKTDVISLGHNYTTITTAPTCETQGFTTYTCLACGDILVKDYVDELGHDWELVDQLLPTPDVDGIDYYVCKNDSTHTKTEIVPATGHTYEVVEVVAPTCTEEGYTLYSCACGNTYKDNIVTPLGHNYHVNLQVAPTCTLDGYNEYVCLNDATHSYKEDVDALGHNYESEVFNPTCETEGYTVHTCSICKDSYKDSNVDMIPHDLIIDITDSTCDTIGQKISTCSLCNKIISTEEIKAKGHDYTSQDFEATCESEGYTLFTCSRCDSTKKENVVPALGHLYYEFNKQDATCTQPGFIVMVCNQDPTHTYTVTIEAPGHQMAVTETAVTCEADGYKTHKCENCDLTYTTDIVKALGHNYNEGIVTKHPTHIENGIIEYSCTRCDHKKEETIDAIGELYHGYIEIKNPLNGVGIVDYEEVKQAVEASKYSGALTITIIDKVNTETEKIQIERKIIRTLIENDKELAFELNNISLSFDAKALESIYVQSSEDTPLDFSFTEIKLKDLSSKQQKGIKDYNYSKLIRLEISNGASLISDFRGGVVEVEIPFNPEVGTDMKDYVVAHIGKDGKITENQTTHSEGSLTVNLEHFSEYAIINVTEEESNGNSLLIIIIIILIIVVAILVIVLILLLKSNKEKQKKLDEMSNNDPEDTPTEETPTEDAAVEEVAEETPAEEAVEEPVVEEVAEETPVEEAVEEPAVEEVAEETPVEEAAEAPAVEEAAEAPAVEEVAEEPAVEVAVEEPAVEEVAEAPAVEEVAVAPAVEEVAEEPAVEEVAEEPAVEEVAEEPAVEEVKKPIIVPVSDGKLSEHMKLKRQQEREILAKKLKIKKHLKTK